MKRTLRGKLSSNDNSEEIEAKKRNLSQPPQDEIQWAPEESEMSSTKSDRSIRIVRSNAPSAHANYGFKPRLIPPWTNRVRANRYLNIDSEEYYIARNDEEVPEQAYVINGSPSVVPVTEETVTEELEEAIVVKTDLDEDEQEIVVDDVNEDSKRDMKPRRSVRARRAPTRTEDVEAFVTGTQEEPMYAYEVVDSELADTVVVDDDSAAHIEGEVRFDIYTQPYTEEVNSLFYLGDEISKHPWQSNDDINHFFVANPSLNYPIDVRQLVTLAKTATPDVNYNLITGLSGLVNSLKREVNTLKIEMNSLRDMVASKQDIGNTKRHFSTMNNVRHQWRIQPQPPLRGVDLVNCARTVDIARGTKKPLSNKEGITRFVKTVLELLIPEEHARLYTVRERTHRRNGLKDIGDHAKDQIIGCVLDLLNLYDIEELDSQGRADRVHFTNLVNQAMRMSLIDLRRSEPRRTYGDSDYAQMVE